MLDYHLKADLASARALAVLEGRNPASAARTEYRRLTRHGTVPFYDRSASGSDPDSIALDRMIENVTPESYARIVRHVASFLRAQRRERQQQQQQRKGSA